MAFSVPRPSARRLPRRLRRPLPFWLLAGALALTTGVVTSRLVVRADAGADRWGAPRPALVATRDLPAGAVLAPGDTEVRLLPETVVPAPALRSVADGRAVLDGLVRGEVVLDSRLAPGATSATAGLLPPGTRGLAIPVGPGSLPLEVGDTVDLIAIVEIGQGGTSDPASPVASGATVVAVDEGAVTVAVPTERIPGVAYALAAGAVTLALVP